MQTNYISVSGSGGAVALPAPRQIARSSGLNRRAALVSPTETLRRARTEAVRAQTWETAAWLALAAGSLAVLVMSLWI